VVGLAVGAAAVSGAGASAVSARSSSISAATQALIDG
jgi:hypothetical protein